MRSSSARKLPAAATIALSPLEIRRHVELLTRSLEKELGNHTYLPFLISSLTEINPFHSTEELYQWIQKLREEPVYTVERVPLDSLSKWHASPKTGNLSHESGKFFSIEGLDVRTNFGSVETWQQPIINQPEVGILGFLTQIHNGILYFLVQAKFEPGNIGNVQISPTVQATRSNYLRVHQGKTQSYLEYFTARDGVRVRYDQLQSEQGGRFFHKRNRNIVVEIAEGQPLEIKPNFAWATLRQIKELMRHDNFVNMDTRTVISCLA